MEAQEAIQKELDQLTRDGVLMPEDVVRFAKNPKTALHQQFEWDDSAAAHQHRLEQARAVIRTYVIVEPSHSSEPVRALVSLTQDRRAGGGYRTIKSVLSDQELYAQLLADALNELSAMQRKYSRIRELNKVFRAAEEAAKQQRFKLVA